MRAIRFHEHGGLDRLKLEDAPMPETGPNDVLIRVRSCGVNRLDILTREGRVGARVRLPHISGSEVAGDVARVGNQVRDLREGQRVAVAPYLFCSQCEYCLSGNESLCIKGDILGLTGDGGYAEYVIAPAANVVPIPEEVSHDDAAAVSLAALTAWHMLVERARVKPGEEVLVLAAGSGVGSAAIQIAKLSGARVIATASDDGKLKLARDLGADEVINYRERDFLQEVRRLTGKRGVDVVVEHVGADSWEKSVGCLARGGRLVTCGSTSGAEGKLNIWLLFAKELNLIGAYGGTRHELQLLLKMVAQGRFRPVIDRALPLERAAEAQRLMEERKQFGKLLLNP